MHVVVDGRMVSNTGIGRWLENIVAHLAQADSGHRITVLVNRGSQRVRPFATSTRRLAISAPLYSIREQLILPLEVFRCRPDLVHYPNFNVPLLGRAPYVMTLCDLIYYVSPQACPSWLAHQYARWMIRAAVDKARKVITISEYSKRDMVRHLGLKETKIAVVYPAVNLELYRPDPCATNGRPVQKKLGIKRPYILYTGNHEPRKNLRRLIEAYRELSCRREYQLVLSGRRDPRRKALYDAAADLVARGEVIFCGEVAEADLPQLYAGASLFVFPSSYEGFGFPPLEAMACGAPVVCSAATSLPEVVGEAALLVSAESTLELRQAMERALGSASLRAELREKGLVRARSFSWTAAAQQVLAVYEEAVQG